MDNKTIELLQKHEGFRSMPYLCTAGKTTIGYGYNLDANPLKLPASKIRELKKYGIGKTEATKLLVMRLEQIENELEVKIPFWSKLNLARQTVFLDMAYNLGVNGLLAFKNTLACANKADYQGCAVNMLDSEWATQVKSRAETLANIMRTGKL